MVENRYLGAIAACTESSNFFASVGFSIFLVYAVRQLDLSPAVIGVVFGVGSVGSLVAAVTATRISGRFGVGPTIVWSAFLFGPFFLLFPLAPKDAAVPFLVAAQLGVGFAVVAYNITQVSFRQAICPERLRGA